MQNYPTQESNASDPPSRSTSETMFPLQISFRTLSYTSSLGDNVHLVPLQDLYRDYKTHPDTGLIGSELSQNKLSPGASHTITRFVGYLFGGFNVLMWIAFTLSILSWRPLGDPPSDLNLGIAVILLVVIVVSAGFYAYIDWNASSTMKSIQSLVANSAVVLRGGHERIVDAEHLVVGDIVLLSMGQRVPADIRLIQVSSDLRFDRSLLTGESALIPGTVDATDQNLLETRNLALSSTFVERGSARGIVFAIGDKTVIGQILKISSNQKPTISPIQREIHSFNLIISSLAMSFFVLALILYFVWIRKEYPTYESLSVAIINAIGCLTGFVPMGLPFSFALALTLSARRMAAEKVLVKNLNTIETLGCMTILCSDKTGTLTLGKMVVDSALFLDQSVPAAEEESSGQRSDAQDYPALETLHRLACLCNDAKFQEGNSELPIRDRQVRGDATDTAILKYSESYRSVYPDTQDTNILFSLAFNSKNKFMAKIIAVRNGSPLLLIKGAPDVLIPFCTRAFLSNGAIVQLEGQSKEKALNLPEESSSQGLRVIALVQKTLDMHLPVEDANQMEKLVMQQLHDLDLVGLLALRDPPRSDTLMTIKTMKTAGIRVFMVTGDYEVTALAIAKSVGILSTVPLQINDLDHLKKKETLMQECRSLVINGSELSSLEDKDWDYINSTFSEIVFARTTPDQKLLIVNAFKARGGNVVGVTGDGTNDGPCLKAADVGIAMGCGSDIAKEAASMILLNNNFSALLIGIQAGRLVFENLKKVIMYLLPGGSLSEIVAVSTNVFLGMQLPMSSFQTVVFCVLNDVSMSVALMYESAESNVMKRPPRNSRTERLTDWKFFLHVYLILGTFVWLPALSMWFFYMAENGVGISKLLFAFDSWKDGWANKSMDELSSLARTGQCIFYVTLVITQLGTLLAVRTRSVSLLESNPFFGNGQNRVILLSMFASVGTALVLLYTPFIQSLFGTSPIPVKFWFIPFGFALGILIMDESRKAIVRGYPKSLLAFLAW